MLQWEGGVGWMRTCLVRVLLEFVDGAWTRGSQRLWRISRIQHEFVKVSGSWLGGGHLARPRTGFGSRGWGWTDHTGAVQIRARLAGGGTTLERLVLVRLAA